MLRLVVLGSLALERDGVSLEASAPRRRVLALLALLAGHGTYVLSREKLLGFLWPESDSQHARNSLKQALYTLRRCVGTDVLIASGDLLRLDPSVIQVDLWEFEAARDGGRAADAVAVYGGPFLDGFFLAGLGEFEEWIEGERRRLERGRLEALEELAERSTAAGDHAAAIHWWRRASDADPVSGSVAINLMRALERIGDRAAALEHARNYEALLAADLGVAVDPEIRQFVDHLRRVPEAAPARGRRQTPAPSLSAASPQGSVAIATVVSPARVPAVAARSRTVLSVILPLVFAVTIASGASFIRGEREVPPPPGTPALFTILPFETIGEGADLEVAHGFDALLASSMGGLDGYRLVPAAASAAPVGYGAATASRASSEAKRVGARYYVTGRLVVTPQGLRAVAEVRDRANADQEVGHSEAEVGRGELFDLADQIVRGLVSDLYRAPGQEMSRAAATATRSVPALKAYLEGERALGDEDYVGARDAFSRAVRADTGFALAYYRWSIAADRAGEDDTARWAAELAAQFSARLSEHDRRLVTAYLVRRRGMLDQAERLYRNILVDYPQDTESWLQLGELLMRGNPLRGRSSREARTAFEKVLAANPVQGDALVQLARVAALDGDSVQADSLIRAAEAARPRGGVLDLLAARAFAFSDRPGAEGSDRELLAEPGLVPRGLMVNLATRPADLADAERLAEILSHARGDCHIRALGHRTLAQVAMARGSIRRFRRELDEASVCEPGAALELRALMAVQAFVPQEDSDLATLAGSLSAAPNAMLARPSRLYYWGRLALRRGDTLAAARAARVLSRSADSAAQGDLARTLGRSLLAHLRFAEGRPAAALAQLESAGWERSARLSLAEASDRFFRAELLYLLGRDEEAIGWFQSIAERASYELVYLAPAQYRLAKIFQARGDSATAQAYYRRVVELWRRADGEFSGPMKDAELQLSAR
jgi:DNA-binding SARP family transcriptional activator